MAGLHAPLDPWPLLPRRFVPGVERAADEPARAVATAGAGLAGLFLALRWLDPALAQEVARLVTLGGCLGGLALVTLLTSLLVGTAIVAPFAPMSGPVKDLALAIFDHAVHLALVLTGAGVLAMIVLHGTVTGPAGWFAGQALLLWVCHRARLWLAGHSAA